jgi:hypothetical protein
MLGKPEKEILEIMQDPIKYSFYRACILTKNEESKVK